MSPIDWSCARFNAEADDELLDAIATPDEPERKLLAHVAAAGAAELTNHKRSSVFPMEI